LNATIQEKSDIEPKNNKYLILPHIHGVSEIVNLVTNKTNFILRYKCINNNLI